MAQHLHPRVATEMLGHSTIAVTMNPYSHLLPRALRDAAALLGTLLAPAGD